MTSKRRSLMLLIFRMILILRKRYSLKVIKKKTKFGFIIITATLFWPEQELIQSFSYLKNPFKTATILIRERLPFVNKNRKFRLETQMVQLIPSESFWKRWKSSEVFLFSRSNRNDRKNPVPFVNSHSTRCTSASFPAIRRCRCSRHFDLLLFPSSRESLGLGETPHRENPVPLRASHSNRIFRSNGERPGVPRMLLKEGMRNEE